MTVENIHPKTVVFKHHLQYLYFKSASIPVISKKEHQAFPGRLLQLGSSGTQSKEEHVHSKVAEKHINKKYFVRYLVPG